jgi:hypothetical protein
MKHKSLIINVLGTGVEPAWRHHSHIRSFYFWLFLLKFPKIAQKGARSATEYFPCACEGGRHGSTIISDSSSNARIVVLGK